MEIEHNPFCRVAASMFTMRLQLEMACPPAVCHLTSRIPTVRPYIEHILNMEKAYIIICTSRKSHHRIVLYRLAGSAAAYISIYTIMYVCVCVWHSLAAPFNATQLSIRDPAAIAYTASPAAVAAAVAAVAAASADGGGGAALLLLLPQQPDH